MPDVFVSYSRRDLEFVQQLVDALTNNGKDPWFDQHKEPLSGIVAGAPWWKEIQYGIETVDNFVFVISPNSIKSPYCHVEINYARERGKRLVPVLYCGWINEGETRRAIDAAIESISDDEEIPNSVTSSILNLKTLVRENWLAISEIQYVAFTSAQTFEQSLEGLIQSLDLDLAWVRMYSQLMQAAKLWEANDFDEDYLWRANRLTAVYEMIERRKPELDALIQKFIEPEQERLLHELESLPQDSTSHERRRDIGDRLAVIGDTRPGVGVKDGVPDMVWLPVEVMPERVTIKTDDIEIGPIALKPFFIAKYQVTYAQYRAFIEAEDGFDDDRWWVDTPDMYKKQELADQRTKIANTPRDTVSWYQALVFGRWLNHRLKGLEISHTKGVLCVGDNAEIRLPTEWEWQWAAMGGMKAKAYPWGEWLEGYANNKQGGLSRTTAVGMYPHGRADCGALDMCGNVQEWCLNAFKNSEDSDTRTRGLRVLRGGSFVSNYDFARAASRGSNLPYSWFNDRGFRVVLVAVP